MDIGARHHRNGRAAQQGRRSGGCGKPRRRGQRPRRDCGSPFRRGDGPRPRRHRRPRRHLPLPPRRRGPREGHLRSRPRGALQLGLHARAAERPPPQGHDTRAAQRRPRSPPDHHEQPGVPQGQRGHRAGAGPRHPRGPSPAPRPRRLLRHRLRRPRRGRALGVALRGPPPVAQLLLPRERADRDRARLHGGRPGDRPVRPKGGLAPAGPRGGPGARVPVQPYARAARDGGDRGEGAPRHHHGQRPRGTAGVLRGDPGRRGSRASSARCSWA